MKRKTGTKSVQRNEGSAEALGELAVPKVGQVDVSLAQSLHERMEGIYVDQMLINEMNSMNQIKYNNAICLGGIEIPLLQGTESVEELMETSRFINLGPGSLTLGIYELLDDDLKELIKFNTLLTMEHAGQLNYLQQTNFATSDKPGWKIVVEIHYYRERSTTTNRFHQDTFGSTLFVNLNYLNQSPIIGPEYVIKPLENERHIKNIKGSLPPEFILDREEVLSHIPDPDIIELVEEIPEYGYVAFVDELIAHSSPTSRHRELRGSDIHDYLQDQYGDMYHIFRNAYSCWSEQKKLIKKDYKHYLPKEYKGEPTRKVWYQIFKHIGNSNTPYNRAKLVKIDSEHVLLDDDQIKDLFHNDSYEFFGEVSIPRPKGEAMYGKSLCSPITAGNSYLPRRMSTLLKNNKYIPAPESGGRRSFFRTWVRAVTADAEVERADWGWQDT